MSTLFKPKYFTKVRDGLASDVVLISKNGAGAVLLLWDLVTDRPYDVPSSLALMTIESGLVRRDFLREPGLPTSRKFSGLVSGAAFNSFATCFFDYLYSRLPLLFRLNPVRHPRNGRTVRPSDDEVNAVAAASFEGWERELPGSIEGHSWSGDWSRSERLRRWFATTTQRERFLADTRWLWNALWVVPELSRNSSVESVARDVIDSSFPMYWTKLESRYRQGMLVAGAMGWLTGTLDIDELSTQIADSTP